jgi:hypothetical protein
MRKTWLAPTPCPDCGSITRAVTKYNTECNGCGKAMRSRAAEDPDSFFTRDDADFLARCRIRLEADAEL